MSKIMFCEKCRWCIPNEEAGHFICVANMNKLKEGVIPIVKDCNHFEYKKRFTESTIDNWESFIVDNEDEKEYGCKIGPLLNLLNDLQEEKQYIYELQAFGYSDFEHYILTHNIKFSKEEFQKVVTTARKKAMYESDVNPYNFFYFSKVINVLKKDFGFKESNHLIADCGCNMSHKVEVERND